MMISRLLRAIWSVAILSAAGCVTAPYSTPAHWVQDESDYAPVGRDFTFYGMHFTSPDEGWIVGGPFFLHIKDGAPSVVAVKEAFLGVTMTGPAEAWASGVRVTRDGRELRSAGLVWTLRDGKWTESALPAVDERDWLLGSIAFTSLGEGWATGSYFLENTTYPLLFHFDGSSWARDGSIRSAGRLWTFTEVCVGPDDATWAVGWKRRSPGEPRQLLAATRVGSEWREIPIPVPEETADEAIFASVSCFAGGLVAGGWTGRDFFDLFSRGVLWTYDGTWKVLELPAHLADRTPSALFATSSADVWIALSSSWTIPWVGARFLHYVAGSGWEEIPGPVLPEGRTTGYDVRAMQFTSPSTGWAIANDSDGPGLVRGLVLQYENGVWRSRNWNWHWWDEPWFGPFQP